MKVKYFDINNKEITVDPKSYELFNGTPLIESESEKYNFILRKVKPFFGKEQTKWLKKRNIAFFSKEFTFTFYNFEEAKKFVSDIDSKHYYMYFQEHSGIIKVFCFYRKDYKFFKDDNGKYYCVYYVSNKIKSLKSVEHIPNEDKIYIKELLIDGRLSDETFVLLKGNKNIFNNEIINTVLGYYEYSWVILEDFEKAVEMLKEWREPKFIKGTNNPPYFIINDKLFEAKEGESWYAYLLRTVFYGNVQKWMLE